MACNVAACALSLFTTKLLMAAPYSLNEHHFMTATSSSLDMTVETNAAPVGLTAMPVKRFFVCVLISGKYVL